MSESFPLRESEPALPPVESRILEGEFWRAVSAQAANENHPNENQDVIRVNPDLGLFILCDGIGGNVGGREAATLVAGAVDEYLSDSDREMTDDEIEHTLPQLMIEAIRHAQARLLDAQDVKTKGAKDKEDVGQQMDTTVTALLVRKLSGGRAVCIIGHVGNSRAYRIRNNRDVDQLTEDQDFMLTPEGTKLVLKDSAPDLAVLDARRRRVRDELANATSKKDLSEEARLFYNYRNITMSVAHTKAIAVDVLPFPEEGHVALISDGVFENLGGRGTERALSMVPIRPADALAPDIVREAQRNGHDRPSNIVTAHEDDVSVLFIGLT